MTTMLWYEQAAATPALRRLRRTLAHRLAAAAAAAFCTAAVGAGVLAALLLGTGIVE